MDANYLGSPARPSRQSRTAVFCLLAAVAAFAGPITTVPWNGHTGAVSFTYDDARSSQIPNLLPQLNALGLKATFFISVTGTGGDWSARVSDWIQVARNGHELANHTRNHVNTPADPNAAAVITDMANYLRGLDTAIQSVTFAYPNCNVNGRNGVNGENFIARGCGQTGYAWNTQPPDWMNVQGLILTPSNSSTAIGMLNSARTNNTWVSLIIHDVAANPDAFSVTPATNQSLLNTAASNSLWIDTYQNIAAYYRAHFTLDAATAAATPSGWSMAWTSPHPRMPRRVNLRVRLDTAAFGTGFTVQQNGATIPRQSDGTYVIDFMRLSLTVRRGATGIHARAGLPSEIKVRVLQHGIAVAGVRGEVEAVAVDIRGHTLFQGRLLDGLVPLSGDQARGLLFLTLRDRASGHSLRAMVNAVR